MHKTLIFFTLLFLVRAEIKAAPGNYSTVTIALTVSNSTGRVQKRLANGNIEYTYTNEKFRITNESILRLAQLRSIMPFGSLKGWQIVSVHDVRDELLGFYAYNKTRNLAFPLKEIFDSPEDDGLGASRSASGKIVATTSAEFVSGNLTAVGTGSLFFDVSDLLITGYTYQTFSQPVKKALLGGSQVMHGATKATFIGDGGEGSPVFGTVSYGASTAIADLSAVFIK